MYFPVIETARLHLRRFAINDLEDYAELYRDPEYTRYSPKGSVPKDKAKQAARSAFEFFDSHWERHGFGVWAMVEKKTNRLIGQCGLNFLPDSPEVEVIYRLDRPYWNQGLTTEAVKATLRYGFEEVKLDRIVAITAPEHLASRRVMEKTGLKYEKDTEFYNLNVVYYTISRSVYQPDRRFLYILQKQQSPRVG